jgi:uncharacterized protein
VRGLDRILELQQLDLSIDRLEARRREIEAGAELEEARAGTRELEDRLGELKLALDSVRMEEGRLDQQVGTLDAKFQAEQRRLYDGSVANPKELESIQAELANIRSRKARLEDEELEQMARREDMESRLPGLEAELAEARAQVAEIESSSERELAEIARALEEQRARREALVREFDGELLDLYEDLRASKRGVGAAALRDGVCQGCHQKLSALELDRVKRAEGVRRCDYCRRILVIE